MKPAQFLKNRQNQQNKINIFGEHEDEVICTPLFEAKPS